jgi:rubrerythrin
MVTLVGTQEDFNDALTQLLELEYDAVEAYRLAIEKLRNESYKARLLEFTADHDSHIVEISKFLEMHNITAPQSGDLIKGMLAKVKVLVGDMTSKDENILRAMLDNEKDTNAAYSRMINHQHKTLDVEVFLLKALEDERRHKAWLERILNVEY